MIIKTEKKIPSSEITDRQTYLNRRQFIKTALAITATTSGLMYLDAKANSQQPGDWTAYAGEQSEITPPNISQQYNNYYEFAFNKEDPAQMAQQLSTDLWKVEIKGEVEKGGLFNLEDIIQKQALEERIYRLRCVEAWSMVIPWMGFPLANLLREVKPLSTARYVKFTSVVKPEFMPNQQQNAMLNWPYVEGLRIDEAMHPLTLLAVGMYGDTLPKQNGAPLRLVVPWKYGFKSIKAIVKIELVKRPPVTSWSHFAPQDYGFYANVNPSVPHPRWSQYTERVLGSRFFTPRRKTELFNGYGEQVASLYNSMDLRHFY